MRSHRLASTALAIAASILAAGCGSGRHAPTFGATPSAGTGAVEATPAAPVPPVVAAAPEDAKALQERDAATAAAAREHDAAVKADAKRRAARHALRDERARADRAHRRAAAREALLRRALAAKAKDSIAAPAAAPTPAPSAPIAASDVDGSDLAADRDRRSDAEARAAVVRFHDLLDQRDAHACLLLTPRLLHALYGDGDDAGSRCAAATRAIATGVSVVVAQSEAHGRRAAVAVVSRMGDAEVAQTLRLVLVDGTWLIDAVERKPAS